MTGCKQCCCIHGFLRTNCVYMMVFVSCAAVWLWCVAGGLVSHQIGIVARQGQDAYVACKCVWCGCVFGVRQVIRWAYVFVLLVLWCLLTLFCCAALDVLFGLSVHCCNVRVAIR